MTQSLSFIVAERPPAMYRIDAVAIVVSRISMNVGTTTAVATNQGLAAGRLTAPGARAALLMTRLLQKGRWGGWTEDFDRSFLRQVPLRPWPTGAADCDGSPGTGAVGPCGSGR